MINELIVKFRGANPYDGWARQMLPDGVDKARFDDVVWSSDTDVPASILLTTNTHLPWTRDL